MLCSIEAGDFVAASIETWRKLGLSVTTRENIFEDHVRYRPKILLSCNTKMMHVRTGAHKASGNTTGSTSLNMMLGI